MAVAPDLLPALAPAVVRATAWLVGTTLLFVPLEAMLPVRRSGDREIASNLGWFFLNSLVTLPVIAVIAGVISWLVLMIEPSGVRALLSGLPLPARLALAMIVGEFGFYWGHRWSHEWPWLWRFHCIHHSPTHMHYLVNTRMHPIDMIFTRTCGVTLLVVFGVAGAPVGSGGLILPLVLLIGSAWSYFIHANLAVTLGPLEGAIATPSFHHWHHAHGDDRGHNYAAMLPMFDVAFGTYRRPAPWPVAYGTDIVLPADLRDQLAFPFMRP